MTTEKIKKIDDQKIQFTWEKSRKLIPGLGRKLYEYQINKNDKNLIKPIEINSKDLGWLFPEKFYESIGFTVSGFLFEFKKLNVESGIKQVENSLNEALFYENKKNIEEKIAKYIAIPTKNVINERYFLYDKSNLIKKTFVTVVNKQLSLYGSFSYFSGKTAATNVKLLTSSDFLKFLIEKKSLKKKKITAGSYRRIRIKNKR